MFAQAREFVEIERVAASASPSSIGIALGATMRHGKSPRARSLASSAALPNHGRCMLALRPACASWIAGTAPLSRRNVGDPLQRRGLAVVPHADVAMGDAALRGDRGRLDHHDAGAALRELAEMHQMPVAGDAVGGRILAHRRNQDAIPGGHAAQA